MSKKKKISIFVITAVMILAASAAVWFFMSHIFVDGKPYAKNAQYLDLRGKNISVSHYEAVQEKLPGCDIDWDVPFQGTAYPENTGKVSFTSLTEEDLHALDYLPQLKTADAVGCTDYEMIQQLKQRHPNCEVLYTVTVDGREYDQDAKRVSVDYLTEADVALLAYLPKLKAVEAENCTDYEQLLALQQANPKLEVSYSVPLMGEMYSSDTRELVLPDGDMQQLQQNLKYLTSLETVEIQMPTCSAEELLALRESYPDVAIHWQKEILGKVFSTRDAEIDLTKTKMETLDEVKAQMAYFPDAEKLILIGCGIDNDTLAAYRDEVREDYKVVWAVKVGTLQVRTDAEYFMPIKYDVIVNGYMCRNLKYCEDMLCVDLGHMQILELDFVKGMPKLKYLIICDCELTFIEPLSTCKSLIYLELFDTNIYDYTPLLGCTALEDLNLAVTRGDPRVLGEMTWLKNLWLNKNGVSQEDRAYLREKLPNTTLEFDHGWITGNGWRQLQNYFDMRDLLGMNYNVW